MLDSDFCEGVGSKGQRGIPVRSWNRTDKESRGQLRKTSLNLRLVPTRRCCEHLQSSRLAFPQTFEGDPRSALNPNESIAHARADETVQIAAPGLTTKRGSLTRLLSSHRKTPTQSFAKRTSVGTL